MDIHVYNKDYEIPMRIYFPTEAAMINGIPKRTYLSYSFDFSTEEVG